MSRRGQMICLTHIGGFSVDKIIDINHFVEVPSIIYAYSRDYAWAILSFMAKLPVQDCKKHFSIKPNGLSYMFEGDEYKWLSRVAKGTIKYFD